MGRKLFLLARTPNTLIQNKVSIQLITGLTNLFKTTNAVNGQCYKKGLLIMLDYMYQSRAFSFIADSFVIFS